MSGKRLRSGLASSSPDSVTVRNLDLATDLMGVVNLGEMAFLELMGRLPGAGESVVFNAMLVALVEHGVTPNTLAARLTYLGAPESLQGAVAAGVLGLGSVFVGTIEGAARMLQEGLTEGTADDGRTRATRIVGEWRSRREPIPGLGHPIHRPADPRTTRLFELAREHGLFGPYLALMEAVRDEAERQTGRAIPINVTGAVGALASEMGIPWQVCRGLGLMARPIGLVAHLLEEQVDPMAEEIWRRVEDEAQAEK